VNVSGFHGCIRKLYINHELQDFTRSHMGAGVEPGCQACRQSYCAHGTSSPTPRRALAVTAIQGGWGHAVTGRQQPRASPWQRAWTRAQTAGECFARVRCSAAALTPPCGTFPGVFKGRACPWTRARTAATAGTATKARCVTCSATGQLVRPPAVCARQCERTEKADAAPARTASPDRVATSVRTHTHTHTHTHAHRHAYTHTHTPPGSRCSTPTGCPSLQSCRVEASRSGITTGFGVAPPSARPPSPSPGWSAGVGAGSRTCCAPLRLRRRRLSFQCDDGTTFTQDVEKPVECGCKEC
ncbi:unnamed protein product, partial [Tetraodon nigroviridis]